MQTPLALIKGLIHYMVEPEERAAKGKGEGRPRAPHYDDRQLEFVSTQELPSGDY